MTLHRVSTGVTRTRRRALAKKSDWGGERLVRRDGIRKKQNCAIYEGGSAVSSERDMFKFQRVRS